MSGAVKERLKSVKSLVPHGTRLLDVGSDHAALPISLFSDNMIISAVISDINEKPLDRARAEVERANLSDKCIFVLSDGFDKIDPDSFDVAAICGMGGMLISDIIKRGFLNGKIKKEHVLIIQPMTDVFSVRKYLWDNGYRIKNELFSMEGKYDPDFDKNKSKPYVVMKAEFDGEKHNYSFGDLFLGKIRGESAAFLCFKEKTKRMLSKKLNGVFLSLKPEKTGFKTIYFSRAIVERILLSGDKPLKKYIRKKLMR